MSGALLKKEMRSCRKMLLLFWAIIALYGATVVAMFDPKLGDSLNAMAAQMPQLFDAFGMGDVGATLTEFAANYLYGFLLVALPLVYIVLLANRLVARYVDRGSMAYLLASPVSRGRIVFTQAFVLVTQCVLLAAFSCGLIMALCVVMFPGELDIPAFLVLNVGMLGVLVFFAGICFLCSCVFNDARMASGVSAGICVLFVLVQMLSNVGDRFDFLRYLTPLTLYDTHGLLEPTLFALVGMGVLYAVGFLCLGIGIGVFRKKDVPV